MTPADVRQRLVDALQFDLIGPTPGSPHPDEVLPQSPAPRHPLAHPPQFPPPAPPPGPPPAAEALPQPPARWSLPGSLAPRLAEPDQKTDEDSNDEPDLLEPGGTDDATPPEPPAARRA